MNVALAWTLVLLATLAAPAVQAQGNRPTPDQRLEGVVVQGHSAARAPGTLQASVEAVRQAVLSTQVPGTVVTVAVKAGDRVAAGQVLVRVDARAAEQQVQASSAQVDAAKANWVLAEKELERQRQLLAKEYISQAALERALAQRDAAQAQWQALQAQTRAAQTQTGFFAVVAPFAGVVSDVQVTLGDMALPGRPLLILHDPSSLRVSAPVAQSLQAALSAASAGLLIELPGVEGAQAVVPTSVQWLPSVDPQTHTATLRLGLPGSFVAVAPGTFARVHYAAPAVATAGASTASATASPAPAERLLVPASSVLRRGELTAVLVLDAQGQPRLRQVRVGRSEGAMVELLSGVRAGETIARDAQAAAR